MDNPSISIDHGNIQMRETKDVDSTFVSLADSGKGKMITTLNDSAQQRKKRLSASIPHQDEGEHENRVRKRDILREAFALKFIIGSREVKPIHFSELVKNSNKFHSIVPFPTTY